MTKPAAFQPSWSDFLYTLLRSPAMLAVLASNVLILLIIPINKQNALNLVWVYWVQSVLLGLLHVLKLLVYDFPKPDRELEPNDIEGWPRIGAALFFLIHYGFFHMAYVFFIGGTGVDWEMVMKAASIFAAQMLLSAIFHYRDESGKMEMGKLFMQPYTRIIPIHIAIILGGIMGSVAVFLFLIVFKTAMELAQEYYALNKTNLIEWTADLSEKMKDKEKKT